MILVRVTFQTQFGKAGELVKVMQQGTPPEMGGRILTDLSGPFDTIVIETVVDSIDGYFRQLQEMFANPDMTESMRMFGEVVLSGHREFYTIESEA